MKLYKKIAPLIILACIAVIFAACGDGKEIADKTPIDTRYTEARQEVVTDYHYRYNWLGDGFVIVPDTHTVTRPEIYEVCYHITYTDGTFADKWEITDKTEYERAAAIITGGGSK